MDTDLKTYLDKRFATLATAHDLVSVEGKIDHLIETTNGFTDRVDRIEKKLDALLYQHRVVERVERIEQVLRDKLHAEL